MTPISTLVHLQSLDREREEKSRRLELIVHALSNDPKLAAARTARDDAGSQLAQLHTAMKDTELKGKSIDDKIKDLETRLASGRITSPKELDALEKDRQMYLRHRGELDTKLLELMDNIERTQKQAAEKDLALKKSEMSNISETEKLERERDAVTTRLAELDAEEAALRSRVDSETLGAYIRLQQSKGGRALSRLKNGACTACGVQIPLGLVSRVRDGEQVVFCPDCGRILVE